MLATEHGATSSSSTQLLAQIQAGKSEAEQALVRMYWRNLYFILINRTRDHALSSDIAQETFIIVIDKARRGQIQNPEALGAFIRQVGINLLIANYRKEARRKTDLDENIESYCTASTEDISKQINSEQLIATVKQVIDDLPTPRDREILHRYFLYGEGKKQICIALDLSSEHFDRVLYRARNRLKQILNVKFNINLKKFGLSTFLSISLVIVAFCLDHGPTVTAPLKIFSYQVGDNLLAPHIKNIAVQQEPSFLLENMRYQTKVRWQ